MGLATLTIPWQPNDHLPAPLSQWRIALAQPDAAHLLWTGRVARLAACVGRPVKAIVAT
eukprot:COSAG01_NODE_65811_length_272_cov_0.601156_1_plen_58_part_01